METKVYHISFHAMHNLACLFFWGCNFDCIGCLRKVEPFDCHLPQRFESPRFPHFLSLSEITTHLKKVRSKIVVFEGWEPTLDPNLSEIASTLRRELKTQNLLLTNGYLLPKLDGIDEVKISLKALSEKIHIEYTGKSNRQVLENFKLLCQSGKRVSAETVLVPGYVDREEIGRIAKFIASIDEGIPLRIDSYWPIASKKWRRPTYEEMREAMREARKHLRKVSSVVGNEPVLGEVKVVG